MEATVETGVVFAGAAELTKKTPFARRRCRL
jgi:hypothetical protein